MYILSEIPISHSKFMIVFFPPLYPYNSKLGHCFFCWFLIVPSLRSLLKKTTFIALRRILLLRVRQTIGFMQLLPNANTEYVTYAPRGRLPVPMIAFRKSTAITGVQLITKAKTSPSRSLVVRSSSELRSPFWWRERERIVFFVAMTCCFTVRKTL